MTVPYLPIQPVAFLIPPDIQLGLDAGKLVRYGGIIRNQLGHIVTHLKEVPIPSKEPAIAQRVAQAETIWEAVFPTIMMGDDRAVASTWVAGRKAAPLG